MGAESFTTWAKGTTPAEAFAAAVAEAKQEYGSRGYTGSIAEKDSFVVIACPADVDPEDYAHDLMQSGDPRINDKWGPAGCICATGGSGLPAPGPKALTGPAKSDDKTPVIPVTVLDSKQVHEYVFFGYASS